MFTDYASPMFDNDAFALHRGTDYGQHHIVVNSDLLLGYEYNRPRNATNYSFDYYGSSDAVNTYRRNNCIHEHRENNGTLYYT
jgi:hypothetical protein